MSSTSDVALAESWAEILEDWKAKRLGLTVTQARSIVARETGVPTGKLYSLRRKRLKDVGRSLLSRLGSGLARELQSLLQQIEHDIQIRCQIGADPRSGKTQALLASRQKIREALGLDAPDSDEGGGA